MDVVMGGSSAHTFAVPKHPSETPARHVTSFPSLPCVLPTERHIKPSVMLYIAVATHHLILWRDLALIM